MRALKVLLFVLLGAVGFMPKVGQTWWNDDWAFRKELTLDLSAAGANVPGNVADTPVLVRLSLGNFTFFGDTKPDGSDLRFIAADDKTPLKHHIEKYDPQAQIALIWVRVPQLQGGSAANKVFLYYGNSAAENAADSGATYATEQQLVYHFGAAADAAQDATSYKAEPETFEAEVLAASLIGAGARFQGNQLVAVRAPGATRFNSNSGYTLSLWLRLEAAQTNAVVAQLAGEGREFLLSVDGLQPMVRYQSGNAEPLILRAATGDLVPDQWHHIALRASGGKLSLLVDGAVAAESVVQAQDFAGSLTVGATADRRGFLRGDIDELQVANIIRSNDELLTAARSQGVVAPLVGYGGDTQREAGDESYFATTLRSVTVDGWVVIAILAVMFFASIAIMIGKLLFLNRVVSGNAKFLADFRKMKDDPTALERREGGHADDDADAAFETGGGSQLIDALSNKETFGVSTLWRLYHHGTREVMKRLQGQAISADRARVLSPQSIEAIRATMDASLTRITQRLQSQMVWLTISISGGPFLGLLGTVVGVMITFAAIAASGDVNINAIAPGTAAALVATVAGLAVAIPCLFGYNYLNTRIKEIVADMRVFVDEFVTRIAETYS